MSYPVKRKKLRSKNQRRFPVILLLVLVWSLAMGWGLASLTHAQSTPALDTIGTIDPVTQPYQLGEELYLENCASCHVGLPPAVLPTQTWKELLQDPRHYSVQIQPLVDPSRLLVWKYLVAFSRPQGTEEQTPYRVNESRYFKALHPKVKLPRPVQISSCTTCHPGASQYNYRRLSSEWQNSP